MRRWWTILAALSALALVGIIAVMALRASGLITVPGEQTIVARELVERTAAALDSVAVKGTVLTRVLTPRGLVRTRAKVHRGDGRVVIRYLSGPAKGTTIYREGSAVWARGPQGRVRRQAELGEAWSRELLRRNWSFATLGRRRVAGRPTIVFTGTGPGGSITVAADRETAFPLGIERRNTDGQILSTTVWQTADFSVAPPPKSEAPQRVSAGQGGRRSRVTPGEARAAADFPVLEPAWLPRGFELEAWYLHRSPGGTMVEARYTDGLRPLLVLERSASASPERGGARRGPGGRVMGMGRGPMRGPGGAGTGAMMRLRGTGGEAVRRVIGDTAVVVMGSMRVEDLERVASSLRSIP